MMADYLVLNRRSQELWEERREARRQFLWTSLLSLFCHIIFIALLAWFFDAVQDRKHISEAAAVQKNEEQPLATLNFVSPPSPNSSQYIETELTQVADSAATHARHESDKDTQAASELPAAGNMPLPTLSGEQLRTVQFKDKEYSPGKHSGGPQAFVDSPQLPLQPEEPLPTATPIWEKAEDVPSLKLIAIQTPPKQASKSSRPQVLDPPSQPEPLGYHAETRTLRIDGNISKKGRAATDARATPLGSYRKLLSNAIGARWYSLVKRDLDLYRIGTVVIRFKIIQNGQVEAVEIVSNTSNELLAATSIQSIRDAEMPPIPPDVAASLYQGRIEVDYSFSIITN